MRYKVVVLILDSDESEDFPEATDIDTLADDLSYEDARDLVDRLRQDS